MNEEQTNLIAAIQFLYDVAKASPVTDENKAICKNAAVDLTKYIVKNK